MSFLLSSITVLVIYASKKIAPFGNNSMLDVDFYHQYGPLLNELYDRVKAGESLIYSFNTGGGIPFYRNFMNYLSSPFNIILFLFKKENIVMAYSIIIAIKTIFSAGFMSIFLKKSFKKDGPLLVVFSLLYAFSGYFCAYYWNIMWLDGMVFLPLIILGINKIIDEDDFLLYIISLSVMLFANYFIAYMICIFSVFYFLGLFWYRKNFNFKNLLKKFLMFFSSSLLAGGLVCFLLLPLFYSLTSISATGGTFPLNETSFSFNNFLFNHLTGVNRTVFASDVLPLPNVYPGMITLVFTVLLFISKKINIRFKIICFLSLLFFYLSFNQTSLDFIWHAFHVPNDLPWRYSFIYTFILITLAYYISTRLQEISLFKICISFAVVLLLTLMASKLGFENINDKRVIICVVILMMYFTIIILIKNVKYNKLYYLLIMISMFECIYGININWNINHDIKTFMSDKLPYQKLIKDIKKEDNSLYRIEKTDTLTLNDGAWYDYYSMSTFSSMAYESVAKFQRSFGQGGNNINSYYYTDYQTPIYNTIFNVKYILGKHIENDYYVPIKTEENYNLTAYKYFSSIAFAVNHDIKNYNLSSYMPFLNQSNFVNLSTNINDVFIKVPIKEVSNATLSNTEGEYNYNLTGEKDEITIILDSNSGKNLYLYVGGDKVNSFSVNDEYYSLTSDEYYVVDVGKQNNECNIKINLSDHNAGMLYLYAYEVNDDAFMKFYNQINKEKLNVTKYSDTVIEGSITVGKNKTIFTSIAYDEGWSVYVDSKRVKTYKIADSYMGFDISPGKHKIKLVYYPKMMKTGLVLSFISLIVIITLFVLKSKNTKKDEFIV